MARTLHLQPNLMHGPDVLEWQKLIDHEFKHLKIDCPIVHDGIYGVHTRSYSIALVKARGYNWQKLMKTGVTPELRDKIRKRLYTPAERTRYHAKTVVAYRDSLRKQWKPKKVHPPVSSILASSWGYHPGVHDGLDVICKPNAAVFAMVRSKVVDVRASGWWGKAPSGDVSKGDGIVQLQVLDTVGPFKRGRHIGYGHCEHARVKVGEVVQAGEVIALAGLAVAWHVHLMYNHGKTLRGVGSIDPRAILDYSVKHG